MAELEPGQVKVVATQHHADPDTNKAYYSGEEYVLDGVTAARMVNNGNGEIVEEGPPTEEDQARADAAEAQAQQQEQADAQAQQTTDPEGQQQ